MNALKALFLAKRQFLLYCVIGFSGVGLHSLVYLLLTRLTKMDYQVANVIGYASGTVLSFVLNLRFNFKVNDRILARFVSFVSVALVGLGSQAATLHLLVEKLTWHKDLSFFLSLVLVVLLQYNLNRLVSFRKGA